MSSMEEVNEKSAAAEATPAEVAEENVVDAEDLSFSASESGGIEDKNMEPAQPDLGSEISVQSSEALSYEKDGPGLSDSDISVDDEHQVPNENASAGSNESVESANDVDKTALSSNASVTQEASKKSPWKKAFKKLSPRRKRKDALASDSAKKGLFSPKRKETATPSKEVLPSEPETIRRKSRLSFVSPFKKLKERRSKKKALKMQLANEALRKAEGTMSTFDRYLLLKASAAFANGEMEKVKEILETFDIEMLDEKHQEMMSKVNEVQPVLPQEVLAA
ncbi:predicted protein [Chaetoceros tenuissimus]|uniref:Uncharacterized protein n=1 Tax=Chaetoceros tenuissimus TaxID=426638 RepID=A0AAD3D6S5_9STRA|nr:predicted protein [Chaetoceros tenuissimus]